MNPHAAFMALAQEPWCFPPQVLARLTPWQAERLYLRPAHERAERLRRETGGPSAGPPGHDWRAVPPREEFVAGMLAAFGGEEAVWVRRWEEMRDAQGGG